MFNVYLTNGKGCFEYVHPNRESAVQWYRALYPTVKAKVRAQAEGEIIQTYLLGGDGARRAMPALSVGQAVLPAPRHWLDNCKGCGELFDDPETEYCEECLRKRAYPEAWPEEELLGIVDAKLPACSCCGAESKLDRQGLCIICAYLEGKGPIDFIGEITGEVYRSRILAA